MAGTINYLYDPDQDVYVITVCDDGGLAVRAGIVIRVRGNVLDTGTDLFYDIQVESNTGTTQFEETDVFADLASAIAEYQTRLTP